ncbi:MAG: hypothetical protein IPL49_18015 [Saprospirales bacterium]|nr:hypothetical protein [Saprospirales bacterium]
MPGCDPGCLPRRRWQRLFTRQHWRRQQYRQLRRDGNQPRVVHFPANLGIQTVTLTAADPSGNTNAVACSFNVVDNQMPTLVCPSNIVAENDPGSCTAYGVTGLSPTFSDNCSFDLSYELEIMPQEIGIPYAISGNGPLGAADIPVGAATLTYTMIDAGGNSANCSTAIEVVDAEAPSIACPALIATVNDPGQCGAVVSFNIEYFDNCLLGPNPLQLIEGQASGAFLRSGRGGKHLHRDRYCRQIPPPCTFTVTVQDTEAPDAVCQDYTVQLDFNGDASIVADDVDGVSLDNCGIQSIGVSPNTFTCANIGPNTVTLTVTDNNGLSSSCNANVMVSFDELPDDDCDGVANIFGHLPRRRRLVDNGGTR